MALSCPAAAASPPQVVFHARQPSTHLSCISSNRSSFTLSPSPVISQSKLKKVHSLSADCTWGNMLKKLARVMSTDRSAEAAMVVGSTTGPSAVSMASGARAATLVVAASVRLLLLSKAEVARSVKG